MADIPHMKPEFSIFFKNTVKSNISHNEIKISTAKFPKGSRQRIRGNNIKGDAILQSWKVPADLADENGFLMSDDDFLFSQKERIIKSAQKANKSKSKKYSNSLQKSSEYKVPNNANDIEHVPSNYYIAKKNNEEG